MSNTHGHTAIAELWNSIRSWLFPILEDEIGELDERHRQFVAVCELCAPQKHLSAYRWIGNGCPPIDRLALCKAFCCQSRPGLFHDPRPDRRRSPSPDVASVVRLGIAGRGAFRGDLFRWRR